MSNDAATSNAKRSSIKTASARSSRMPVKSYPAPRISRNSARYQRIRMFSELAQGGCPVVQAENKNSSLSVPMEIEVSHHNQQMKLDCFLSVGSSKGWS